MYKSIYSFCILIIMLAVFLISSSCAGVTVKEGVIDTSLSFQELFNKGRELYLKGELKDLDLALEYYKGALEVVPESAQVLGAIAETLAWKSFLMAINQQQPWNTIDKAQSYADQALDIQPENIPALRAKCNAYVNIHIFNTNESKAETAMQAANLFVKRLLETDTSDGETLYTAWRVLYYGVLDNDYLLQASVKSPEFIYIYQEIAQIFIWSGKLEQALEMFDIALTINPESSTNLYYKGLILQNFNELEQAIDLYQEAISFNEEYSPALKQLGIIYYSKNNYDKALEYLEKVFELGEEDYTSIQLMAIIRMDRNENEQAIELLEYSQTLTKSSVDRNKIRELIDQLIRKTYISYSDHTGESIEEAIHIENAYSLFDGIPAIMDYLSQEYGYLNEDFFILERTIIQQNEEMFYQIQIGIEGENAIQDVYFNITDFAAHAQENEVLRENLHDYSL